MRIIQAIVSWFEKRAFGVCSVLGDFLGIRSDSVRKYFIYLSFFTAGSPIIFYFVLAFVLEHKKYFRPFRTNRSSVWEL
jgi:phage shock protein PspC (stress-responsive transcriptional regulator)